MSVINEITSAHQYLYPPAGRVPFASYVSWSESAGATTCSAWSSAKAEGGTTSPGDRQNVVSGASVTYSATVTGSLDTARMVAAQRLLDTLVSTLPAGVWPSRVPGVTSDHNA